MVALPSSAAIGAFSVGLALSGSVQERAGALIGPLRDLFAAVFFLFFSFQIRPGDLLGALGPAVALAAVALSAKLLTGWVAAGRAGVGRAGRLRAGATLMARGEFSIVIASIGALSMTALTSVPSAAFVLLTAIAGPLAARFIGRVPHRDRHAILWSQSPQRPSGVGSHDQRPAPAPFRKPMGQSRRRTLRTLRRQFGGPR